MRKGRMDNQNAIEVRDEKKLESGKRGEFDVNDCSDMEREDVFVNKGLEQWEQTRARWLEEPAKGESRKSTPSRHAIPLDVDEIIDIIFSNRWRGGAAKGRDGKTDDASFPRPVPLPQMVDILVDLWEAEGLDI
mmetsp:Transcript_53914/g.65087  ORF Transcript_53914/g.65087 Transcript_53914/m.65087 type:complete len:134 (+) Transcript_53914:113-514(+)|eukprot:CAMPEP_0172495762 /NCGR_PEP_ID=MMETSP1066-20121228/76161_1 /TAXON_ID=671091 /ORGANISM="Coscinodiscus wailesii, Strain CCMP2513" /LENGTH=133 /DNA_ID=CAMNT_0013267653 /DNA_START=79 /DNA_END=480 /DNA_ORIENTATION=+